MHSDQIHHYISKSDSTHTSLFERFVIINQGRLNRLRQELNPQQNMFFDVLPLLFHENYPALPGYRSGEVPVGILNYHPDREVNKTARHLFQVILKRKLVTHRHDILGLYLIGSSGSIGHSIGSDYDIWLCHKNDLEAHHLQELKCKASAIEAWAQEIYIKITIYFVTDTQFKEPIDNTPTDFHNYVGQRSLLLDEFYRSGLVLAGLFPAWWRYYTTTQETAGHDYESSSYSYFINFGQVSHIPINEISGSACWLLGKAVRSPYKALLKLLCLEEYTNQYPHINLLSYQYKDAILHGESNLNHLDPYFFLYKQIEKQMVDIKDWSRLEITRICFYLKAAVMLGNPGFSNRAIWRREFMLELTEEWNWSKKDLRRLDRLIQQEPNGVLAEKREIVNALMQSFNRISEFVANERTKLT